MLPNTEHFNLPSSYEYRKLESGDKELESPETKWK